MTARIIVGDCLDVMATMEADSVDAIVTDPPYHLTTGKKGGSGVASEHSKASPFGAVSRLNSAGFMGKKWDGGDIAHDSATWAAALRVAKPGAHLLAFGGTRTFHRLACAIEDAGWELRDTIMWVYGSGFPKSHNGPWGGTALKPAWEPIIVARKPLIGTVAANVLQHGTGALNIDGCRIGVADGDYDHPWNARIGPAGNTWNGDSCGFKNTNQKPPNTLGRWPANLCHDGSDEVLAVFPADQQGGGHIQRRNGEKFPNAYGDFRGVRDEGWIGYADAGSAARFFYCSKADRADRNAGCEHIGKRPLNWSSGDQSPGTFQAEGTDRSAHNHHPTVKPTDLMRWLCRLVTPRGGTILDPFCGSGSTGKAALLEGFRFVGIELSEEYAEIARARIYAAAPLFAGVA